MQATGEESGTVVDLCVGAHKDYSIGSTLSAFAPILGAKHGFLTKKTIKIKEISNVLMVCNHAHSYLCGMF